MASIPTAPSGSAADNELFVAEMRPALVKFFRRRCGTTHEAEDLAQDVLVKVLPRATWKSPEQAKGYIFRAAVNHWRDRNRKTQTRGVAVEWNEALEPDVDEEISPEHVVTVEQTLTQVAGALLELDERSRDVFVLIRLEQMKQSAVAEMLGVSVSTVEKELVKALAHLARRARQWNGTP
jgi:RNA polymerase sigma-70 factor (ECF subfamily)